MNIPAVRQRRTSSNSPSQLYKSFPLHSTHHFRNGQFLAIPEQLLADINGCTHRAGIDKVLTTPLRISLCLSTITKNSLPYRYALNTFRRVKWSPYTEAKRRCFTAACSRSSRGEKKTFSTDRSDTISRIYSHSLRDPNFRCAVKLLAKQDQARKDRIYRQHRHLPPQLCQLSLTSIGWRTLTECLSRAPRSRSC